MRSVVLIIVAVASLVFAAPAFAQTSNAGVITGTVTDDQGLALPGATVELTNTGTGTSRVLVSESNGAFTFSAVDPGTYSLKITLQGFGASQRSGIQLRSRETLK